MRSLRTSGVERFGPTGPYIVTFSFSDAERRMAFLSACQVLYSTMAASSLRRACECTKGSCQRNPSRMGLSWPPRFSHGPLVAQSTRHPTCLPQCLEHGGFPRCPPKLRWGSPKKHASEPNTSKHKGLTICGELQSIPCSLAAFGNQISVTQLCSDFFICKKKKNVRGAVRSSMPP